MGMTMRCYCQWLQLLAKLPTHGTQQLSQWQLGLASDPAKAAAIGYCLKILKVKFGISFILRWKFHRCELFSDTQATVCTALLDTVQRINQIT